MKRRGLRRYFRNLKSQKLPQFLDFSSSEQSWFDFYHLHIDDTGIGNRSWKARKQHLNALFDLAGKVEAVLQQYSKDYQYWIEIDENDSVEDAIYIHTQNPNGSTFPIRLDIDNEAEVSNPALLEYLREKDYQIEKKILFNVDSKAELTYFLYKDGIGTKKNKTGYNTLQALYSATPRSQPVLIRYSYLLNRSFSSYYCES